MKTLKNDRDLSTFIDIEKYSYHIVELKIKIYFILLYILPIYTISM